MTVGIAWLLKKSLFRYMSNDNGKSTVLILEQT